jgi:hypothetical protein
MGFFPEYTWDLHVYTRNINGIYCLQDCLATIPPYPYYIGDRGARYDVVASIADPDSMWIVRPQLFFTCTVRPPHTTRGHHNKYAEDIALNLVVFSAFEDLLLRTLAQWSQTELGSCMNPSLSPLSMLAGWKTFLGGCHSFLAFLMATPHLLFRMATPHLLFSICMLDDRSRSSNSGVLAAKALHHAGAAMS